MLQRIIQKTGIPPEESLWMVSDFFYKAPIASMVLTFASTCDDWRYVHGKPCELRLGSCLHLQD